MKTSSGYRTRFFLVLLAASLAACGGDAAPEIEVAARFTVLSESFQAGAEVPIRYTCDGEDVSPSLGWEYRGGDAKEFVVVMTDEDTDGFVHWLVWGIPGEVSNFPANTTPTGAILGRNDFGSTGYRGPCPTEGEAPHRYVFTVYALNRSIGGAEGPTLDDVLATIGCCVVAEGTVAVTYGR